MNLKNIHPSVVSLPVSHFLHYKKVIQWIVTQTEIAKASQKISRTSKDLKIKQKELSNYMSCKAYVRHMEHYLRHGDWADNFYGEYQEKRVRWVKIS